MRKILVALVFLALMSIPITISVATEDTVTVEDLIKTIDPSEVPKSEPVTSMAAGVASTYNIYPSTTNLNVYYTLSDTWRDTPTVALLAPKATGHYDFYVWIYLTNPSYKWACACLYPYVSPVPAGIISAGLFSPGIPSNSYLKYVASNITWSGQNLFVWRVYVIADVVSTSGVFSITMRFNQLRTDLNGDRIVNILDVNIVAQHYGEVYQSGQSQNYSWNVITDSLVEWTDLVALQYEFGRTIPP